jgi:DnaK suppressor protein
MNLARSHDDEALRFLNAIRRQSMDPAQLDHFRQRLRTLRAELHAESDAIPPIGEAEGGHGGDMADQSSAETDRDLTALNRERTRLALGDVDRALARIENGTFGICEDTGLPIGFRRLEVQPTATLSIEAQEQRESEARMASR